MEPTADRDRITAVVLLTDGMDTASQRRGSDAIEQLQRQGRKETGQVRLFTIAYGREPDQGLLEAFAQATGGKAFVASTDDIEAVYRSISSFF
jgi:Mg-chelatase subunit ChlD